MDDDYNVEVVVENPSDVPVKVTVTVGEDRKTWTVSPRSTSTRRGTVYAAGCAVIPALIVLVVMIGVLL